jgi:drug/metabolite transporter (DMT)-like permease
MSGAVWAIGAAVVFSLGHVAIRKAVGTVGVTFGTAIMLIAATLTVGLAALLFEDRGIIANATREGVLFFATAGAIHYIGGWGFMNASTRLVGAARMSAITGVTPLFAALLAVLTLQESLNIYLALGIVMIVIGAYFIATG